MTGNVLWQTIRSGNFIINLSENMKILNSSLILRIIAGLIIGTLLGLFLHQLSGIGFVDLFIGILKAIAPFLVFFIIMSVIPKASSNLGSRFKSVIILYLSSMILAALVSISMSFIFPVSFPFKFTGKS